MTPGHVTSPIILTSGAIVINTNLTITGPGASTLTVSGNNNSLVFSESFLAVAISGLTISGGKNTGGLGGGIYTDAPVTLTNSTVSGNIATTGGGGIFNEGTLTMTNSIVSAKYRRLRWRDLQCWRADADQ